MDSKLNLTLPEKSSGQIKISKAIVWLLCALLIVSALNILLTLNRSSDNLPGFDKTELLSPDKVKELALRMEKQDLTSSAVETWKEYMAVAELSAEEQAKIWYRMGKLFQSDGDYQKALAAYYRSEGLGKLKELSPEINRRVQESLERLGRFSALRYELDERTRISDKGKTLAGEEILAEIGSHKITKRELDSRIEKLIEGQLAPLAARISEKELNSQKELLLKRFSSSIERRRLLNQIVVEELLFRKAVEDNLQEKPEVRLMLQQAERAVMAQQVLAQESSAQINITETDLETYYKAHQKEFMDPEQAKISHILVKDNEIADGLLSKLKKGETVADLAKKYSLDENTRDNGGIIDIWSKPGNIVEGIGQAEEINRAIFAVEAGTILPKAMASSLGIHIIKVLEKKNRRQKDFAEVQQEVYKILRSQKEEEVQQNLFKSLQNKYNVVIHSAQFMDGKSEGVSDKGIQGIQQGINR